MYKTEFLMRQKRRIEKRVVACERVIRSHQIHSLFKAQKVIGQQHTALARIHTGFYGQCIDCGKAILKRRLEAVPAAIRCVVCQKEAEV